MTYLTKQGLQKFNLRSPKPELPNNMTTANPSASAGSLLLSLYKPFQLAKSGTVLSLPFARRRGNIAKLHLQPHS